MTGVSQYTKMQQNFYRSGTTDHEEHNSNPWYWKHLMGEVIRNSNNLKGLNALDFGCGKGRNIRNLARLAEWSSIDGIDISENNIDHCQETLNNESDSIISEYSQKHRLFLSSGSDTGKAPKDFYHFITSTIVFQHIPVYSLRKTLINCLYELLTERGKFSLQMGLHKTPDLGDSFKFSKYYDECIEATSTNGMHNVYVETPRQLVTDFLEAGFMVDSVNITPSWSDACHPNWIWIVGSKK